MLVTSPANISAVPNARRNGHAVDAGTSISRGARGLSPNWSAANGVAMCTSASQNVNYGKNHDPYGIDEMPVHRKHFDTLRLVDPHTAGDSKNRDRREHHQTNGYVKSMQADKRVIGGSEQIGG